MIERWDNADGSTSFLWSLWQSGRRLQMGGGFESAPQARQAALDYCLESFGSPPDRVREL